jgi:arylsulfatase A-like enzyme
LLSAAGYTSGHFGKWHLGLSKAEYFPTNRGFDESLTWYHTAASNSYRGAEFIVDDDVANPITDGSTHSAHTITEAALAFINARWAEEQVPGAEASPFFLNIWYRTPHLPIDPPALCPNPPSPPDPQSAWPSDWLTFTAATPGLDDHGYQGHDPTVDAKTRSMYGAMVSPTHSTIRLAP